MTLILRIKGGADLRQVSDDFCHSTFRIKHDSRRIMQSITDEGQSWFCQYRIGGPLGAVCTLLLSRYYRAGKLLHVGQIGFFAHPSTGSGLTDLFLLQVSWLLNADDTYLMQVGDSG